MIFLFATTLRTVKNLSLISFCLAWKRPTATSALSWREMQAVGNVRKIYKKSCDKKCMSFFLLLLGIPEVVSTKIRKECKRFVLIMSKNVATDPTCIWACEVAVEKAISGRTHKQLISIYPPDKKKVCSHIYPDVSCL